MSRVYQSESGRWGIDYTDSHGKRIRKIVANTKTQAEKILRKIQYDIDNDRMGINNQKDISAEELFKRFINITRKKLTESSWDTYEHRIEFWRQYHKGIFKPLSRLDIEKIISKDLSHLANKTLNSYINLLKQIYDYAISINVNSRNPVKDMPSFPARPQRKPRFLTHSEFEQLIEHSPQFYKDLWNVFVYTGMRRNEARYLEWSEIDFKNNVIRLGNKENFTMKNKQGRIIPMHPKVREILKRIEKNSALVFPSPRDNNKPYANDNWRQWIKEYSLKAGLENVSLHTLRHTFASWLVMEGVDLTTVSKLLGHQDITTTMIYAHLSPKHLRDAVEKL